MIKNILFDLGGVIMDIRRENAVKALEEIGMTDANSFLGEYVQSGPFLSLEEGRISPDEFRREIRALIPDANPKDEEIDAAFCRFLVGIPEYRLDKLLQLKRKGYGIYMLSNTNPIMWESEIRRQFTKQGKQLDDYFDGVITSFEAKVCKPSPEIFMLAVGKFGIRPEETIFIDDSAKNTLAAEKLGFLTATINPGEDFVNLPL